MQTSAQLDRAPATSSDPSPKPLTLAPLSVRSSSSLTEDFLSRQDLFLNRARIDARALPEPVQGRSRRGRGRTDGNCWMLDRGPNGGTWQLEKYPTEPHSADGCTEVVSVIYPDGKPGVLAALPGWLYYYDITADGPKWLNGDSVDKVSNLKVSYTPPLPQRIPVVYGATPDGNLMVTLWSPSEIPTSSPIRRTSRAH